MINSYPKIFSLGQTYIKELFDGPVEVTEKVDGSQLSFAKIDGELYVRSKGKIMVPGNVEKMFNEGVAYIESIRDRLEEGMVYYCEYLSSPHHNVLTYSRTPKHYLALFGVMHISQEFRPDGLDEAAERLDIDRVPEIYKGVVDRPEMITEFLERDSFLGNTKIEGVVIKNYAKPFLLGGQPIPVMSGKLVSEKFKEVHKSSWGAEHSTGGRMEVFLQSFKTEARWEKAIQHCREDGKLADAPQDIGMLIKEIHADIESEEKEFIKEFLWKEYKDNVFRAATAGFPSWYKDRLMTSSFKSEEESENLLSV